MSARTTFLWTRTRSVLIPKPEAGAYRPIGIGDAFYRLLMRLAYSQKAEEIGSSLAPRQLAVGVAGGCEIGAHMAHLQFWQPHDPNSDWQLAPAIISVDAKIAGVNAVL